MALKATLLNVGLLALSSLLCLSAVEGVFAVLDRRGAGAQEPESPLGPGTELLRFTRYHPLLGHDGRPNVRGMFGRKRVTHNSKGNRSPEVGFEKPEGLKRVVVLGDSQAWGYGVNDDETIAARLERLLNQGPSERYQVVNLGISGYGTDQSFLRFLLQGIRYSPDYVVLVVFKNDIHENEATAAWGVEKPRFFLKDGELCLGNVPPRRAAGWPEDNVMGDDGPAPGARVFDLRKTHTFRFLAGREWRWRLPPEWRKAADEVRRYVGCIENRPSYEGSGEDLLVRFCGRLERICRERGARFLVSFTPKPREVEDPATPAYYDEVRKVLDRDGIASVDFRDYLGRRSAVTDVFGARDPHLSAAGSRLAAEALAEVIQRATAPGAPASVSSGRISR